MESKPDEYCGRTEDQSVRTLLPQLLFAVRNVFRHRARSAATLAAISFGIASLILAGGFIQDIFKQLGEAIIHSQTGHIQITQEGYAEGKNRAPERYLIKNPRELKSAIQQLTPQIEGASSRLTFSGTLNNGRRDLGIIGEGVEPDSENKLGTHLSFVEGRPLRDSDGDQIVVGHGVAKALGLGLGDHVTLLATLPQGAVNTLDFEVVGIFQSFSKEFDARAVRIPLSSAQTLMDTADAHILVISLTNTEATAQIADALRKEYVKKGYSVTAWNELSDFYEKTVELYDRQFGVLRLIILVMVLLSVANSVNMTVFERTREFGTMLAIGDTKGTIFRLILIENLCLGLLGSLVGMLAGMAVALAISSIGIPMPPPPNSNIGYIAQIQLDPSSIATAGTIGFFACVLAAIIPALRASRLDIGEALRSGI